MANIKNYSDITGEAIELKYLDSMANAEFAARFPGVSRSLANSSGATIGIW